MLTTRHSANDRIIRIRDVNRNTVAKGHRGLLTESSEVLSAMIDKIPELSAQYI